LQKVIKNQISISLFLENYEIISKKESDEALSLINLELDKLSKHLLDKERLLKIANDDLNKEKVEVERILNE
jgi:hypothetical protein